MLKLEHISKVYRAAEVETAALDDLSLRDPARRVPRHHGPFRLRQVDAAQHPRPHRLADGRQLLVHGRGHREVLGERS